MNGHQKQREQSCRMIEDGLFQLMKERPYAQITVSEITKRADISRRTFYRLYQEKDAVLHHYFERLCQEYRRKSPVLENYNIPQIAREYFSFWYQYKDFLLLMHKAGLDEMLYYEISRASREVVKARIGREAYKDSKAMEYFADYSTGGFVFLLQRWILKGMEEKPEQYARTVSESLLKYINSTGSLEEESYAGDDEKRNGALGFVR